MNRAGVPAPFRKRLGSNGLGVGTSAIRHWKMDQTGVLAPLGKRLESERAWVSSTSSSAMESKPDRRHRHGFEPRWSLGMDFDYSALRQANPAAKCGSTRLRPS